MEVDGTKLNVPLPKVDPNVPESAIRCASYEARVSFSSAIASIEVHTPFPHVLEFVQSDESMHRWPGPHKPFPFSFVALQCPEQSTSTSSALRIPSTQVAAVHVIPAPQTPEVQSRPLMHRLPCSQRSQTLPPQSASVSFKSTLSSPSLQPEAMHTPRSVEQRLES